MNIFVSTAYSLESPDGCGNHESLEQANVFIVEDNVLWHFGGPFDHTGSHENWFQGCDFRHFY